MIDSNRPLRVLERAIQGGLGAGNLGVVVARHGTGKVAVLTTIAMDHAMDGRSTLHIALGKGVNDIRAYEDEVLDKIIDSLGVADGFDRLAVDRCKQIYTYKDSSFTVKRLHDTLVTLAEHQEFHPEMIEIQGWPDFGLDSVQESMSALKKLAEEFKAEVWFTAHSHREDEVDARGVPTQVSQVDDLLSVIIALEENGNLVDLKFPKTHDETPSPGIKLQFDPKTMLIRWR